MEPWLWAVVLKPLIGGLVLLLICAPVRWGAQRFLPEGRTKRTLLSSKPLLYLAYVFWPALIALVLIGLTLEVIRKPEDLIWLPAIIAIFAIAIWLDKGVIFRKSTLPQTQQGEPKR